ncbi:alpha/beta fold hydrolase [Actinomadura formosensis]|uniref:alpha/beta fold hydrolase n=1 Tax=Actinomadura formosensis TaxID=60706 RepID=UPI000831A3E6|nr:alpha/beta fold hydrolase [Actinomadura formosensis]
MPIAAVNDIQINYRLEGDGPETIVLVNGLADDLNTWDYQVPAFLEAGYRVLRFDNRGVGETSKPEGPYTSRMLADDAKALVDHLGITDFHLMGTSMGGMISQEYAINYGSDLRSLVLSCTYAAPGPFCSRLFTVWAELAPTQGVPFIMREVTLWAFTQDFFETRGADLAAFEDEMAAMPWPVEAYLSQLNVIREHDTTDRLSQITVPTLVQAGEEDILIPVRLSRRLHQAIPDAEWATTRGGHACLWEHPDHFNTTLLEFWARHRRATSPAG